MQIHELGTGVRVVETPRFGQRIAQLQIEDDQANWVTKTSRFFEMDIRVDLIGAMKRVASQRGLIK